MGIIITRRVLRVWSRRYRTMSIRRQVFNE